MDVSPNFIKMCEKATEIQELWQFDNGDFFTTLAQVKHNIIPAIVNRGFWKDCLDKHDRPKLWIWLPRQDQLQEIANTCCTDPTCLLIDFYHFVTRLPNPAPPYMDSFEQLWLAFVMEKKYNKVWNGEDWE